MSGIYIHIPYCKKACIYCDFHFSTQLKTKNDFLRALLLEIELTSSYLSNPVLNTIYFGGGTPSVLDYHEWMMIFEKLSKYYDLSQLQEVTLEANPDDLSVDKINDLLRTPINRLSIGLQSFHEEHLKWMNRSHTLNQSQQSLQLLKNQGFKNINIDLIYGFPALSMTQWEENIRQAVEVYEVPHISAYFLTIEPKTALHQQVKNKKIDPEEQRGEEHYHRLCDLLKKQGYEHYETSNFSKPGFRAKHNSSYWNNTPYLGLGPSAHSFNGHQRAYTISNNPKYIKSLLEEGQIPQKIEHLQDFEQFNDFIITRLRTQEGIQKAEVERLFSIKYWVYIQQTLSNFTDANVCVMLTSDAVRIAEESWIYQDAILRELILVDNLQ